MTTDFQAQRILILDFGSQYTQLIARRIRELGVYCEIHPYTVTNAFIEKFAPQGIILSGGPASVLDGHSPRAPELVFKLGCPVLGICYGMQTMAEQLGGRVAAGSKREFGYAEVELVSTGELLQGIEDRMKNKPVLDVWMSHGDHVSHLPPHFSVLASTKDCSVVAMGDEKRHFYGLQFHPEVTHTRQGGRILERFILKLCACQPNWVPSKIIEELIEGIQQKVGTNHVILALSGGVDSSVLAALLHRAIGKQLTCIFVDTGLLRLNEAEQVKDLFAKHLGIHLITVQAEKRFLVALKDVVNPEQKRKIIGNLFVQIFEEESHKIKNAIWLAQGTIYSDVIESAGTQNGQAHVIKSHHNVGGLPKTMRLKLLEPLRELFKDEVRKIGLELGLPHDLVYSHPFPGPGLAVRTLGEVKKEHLVKLRLADAILIEELYKAELYYKVSQAFAVFLAVQSVGVIGDRRHYDDVIALRVVESTDFMTAQWAELPHAFLAQVSTRIINEVPGISRVVYDITGKPPATIEWE